MAARQNPIDINAVAQADLSTKQFYLVKKDTSNKDGVVLSGDGNAAIGVLINKPASGKVAKVQVGGVAPVKVGSTGLTVGVELASNANGEAVTATTGEFIIGVAMEAAVSGQVAEILLHPRGYKA